MNEKKKLLKCFKKRQKNLNKTIIEEETKKDIKEKVHQIEQPEQTKTWRKGDANRIKKVSK